MRKFAALAFISLFIISALAVLTFVPAPVHGAIPQQQTLGATQNVTIAYSENFDDDAVGQVPSASWYTYEGENSTAVVVSNSTSHSSPNSLYYPEPSGEQDVMFNFTAYKAQYTYVSWWMNEDSSNTLFAIDLWALNSTGTEVTIFAAEWPSKWHADSGTDVAVHYNGTWSTLKYTDGTSVSFIGGQWVQVEFFINWTAQNLYIIYNGKQTETIPFNNAGTELWGIKFHSNNNYQSVAYIDDIEIGNITTGSGEDDNTITVSSSGYTLPNTDPQGLYYDGTYFYEGTTNDKAIYKATTSGSTVQTYSMPDDHIVSIDYYNDTTIMATEWSNGIMDFVNLQSGSIERSIDFRSLGWSDSLTNESESCRYFNESDYIFLIKWVNNTNWNKFRIYLIHILTEGYEVVNYWNGDVSSIETQDAVAQAIEWDAKRGILWYATAWYGHSNAKLWALSLDSNHNATILKWWDLNSNFGSTEMQGLTIDRSTWNTLYTGATGTSTIYKIDISQVSLTGNFDLGVSGGTTSVSVSITSPSNNTTLNTQNVTVQWQGSGGIDHYEIQLDGSSWINVGTNTSYTFTGLSDGQHTVTVRAYDSAGNYTSASASFTIDTGNGGGDNNNTNDTNNTGGAGNPTGNGTSDLMKFLLEKVKIGDYAVPVWVLVAVAILFLLVIFRRR